MAQRVNYGGVVIAGIGFLLTRFTVTLAIYDDPLRFYLAGVVPLVLGLGLAAFGVALAVADVERATARLTALWCVAGVLAMAVLVVLTLLGSSSGGTIDPATVRSRSYLSNFLVGGAIGGTVIGLFASRDRRNNEELRHQANRLEVLNRLLRHEVLNALTAIRGYAGDDDAERARAVIEERAGAIERTIQEVKYLTRTASASEVTGTAVDLADCLAASVETVSDRYPEATVSVEGDADVPVRANDRLEHVFTHLLENAIVHAGGDSTVEVRVDTSPGDVRVRVSDDGPGLPADQRALLESGEIGDFDDPGTGFGLNVVRLLVESYRGALETDVADGGTTIVVALRRAAPDDPGLEPFPRGSADLRPAIPHLVVTLAVALVAGVVYGAVSEGLGGSIGIIGVLYGVESAVVGWITHEFHSVVFGFVFLGLVSLLPTRYRNHLPAYVAVGAAWGLLLWLFAAGVVSPIWLRLLGIPAEIPSLSILSLASHLAWGLSLGAMVALGFEHATPWLVRAGGGRERATGDV